MAKLVCINYTDDARNRAYSSAEGEDKSAASADGVDLAGVIRVVHGACSVVHEQWRE